MNVVLLQSMTLFKLTHQVTEVPIIFIYYSKNKSVVKEEKTESIILSTTLTGILLNLSWYIPPKQTEAWTEYFRFPVELKRNQQVAETAAVTKKQSAETPSTKSN